MFDGLINFISNITVYILEALSVGELRLVLVVGPLLPHWGDVCDELDRAGHRTGAF